MTVGDGIFYGLLVASFVGLYVATKDRWRWRRIAIWLVALCVVPTAAVIGWFAFERWSESRPRFQSEFWELRPGMSADEVIFRKGKPTQQEDRFWAYLPDGEKVGYVVGFKEGRVHYVEAVTRHQDNYYLPTLLGISSSTTIDELKSRFGEPDWTSVYEDRTSRQLNFAKFGITVQLEKNRVTSVGVFDPALGPVRFNNEAAAPTK